MQRTTATFLVLATMAAPAAGTEGGDGGARIAVPEGARVRLSLASRGGDPTSSRETLVGVVIRSERETLWLSPAGGASIPIPTAVIDKVEISRGRHSRRRGAALGAGVGAAGGLIATAVVAGTCHQTATECAFGTNVSALVYTPLAVILGALIGAATPPAERWNELDEDRARVRVQPLVQGAGFGVRLAVDF